MDTHKVGTAAARVMDLLEKLESEGAFDEDAEIAEAFVVVALNAPNPEFGKDANALQTVSQVVMDGTSSLYYVRKGVLQMALALGAYEPEDD